jgi:hypothetical protein
MNPITRKFLLLASLGICWSLAGLRSAPLCAQVPFPFAPQTTPDAQRNALNGVRSQINWLQNASRTAPNQVTGGYEKMVQEFQTLRGTYGLFTSTLTPQQLNYGANDLAELAAGLDILQEAFGNFQQDLAAGRAPASAFRDLCQVLARGSGVWGQQLNRVSARLRAGWP